MAAHFGAYDFLSACGIPVVDQHLLHPACDSARDRMRVELAGTGVRGYNGDNRPAIAAQLPYPYAVTVDASGNLFIADALNRRIRRVDAGTKRISTVAGTGILGYNGDGQAATAARLAFPYGVAVDASLA